MKAIIPTIIYLLFAVSAIASEQWDPSHTGSKCRTETLLFPASFTAAERMEADLLQGVWTEEPAYSESSRQFQFHDYGVADELVISPEGHKTYNVYLWTVENRPDGPYLVLHRDDFATAGEYKLEPTCHGLVFVDPASLESIRLVFNPKKPSKALLDAKTMLQGEWTNVTSPFDKSKLSDSCGNYQSLEECYVHYSFSADGTYTRAYGTREVHLQESGIFELSDDGRYILLRATGKDELENSYQTSVVQIKHLSMGEMVLEQEVCFPGLEKLGGVQVKTVTFMQ